MKLEEAILTIENEVRVAEVNDQPRAIKALKLGSEALKSCQSVAEGYQYWYERPLFGETI